MKLYSKAFQILCNWKIKRKFLSHILLCLLLFQLSFSLSAAIMESALDQSTKPNASPPQRSSVLIVAGIDGSLTGLDINTGDLLWKQEASFDFFTPQNGAHDTKPRDQQHASSILSPLLSTTTTTRSSALQHEANAALDYTLAVPWTDGRRVSLTAQDVTVTTTMSDLCSRAPFVDARGRLYTASSKANAFLLDASNGNIVQVEPVAADGDGNDDLRQARPGEAYRVTDIPVYEDLPVAFEHTKEFGPDSVPMDVPGEAIGDESAAQEKASQFVWLGRVDETVTLYKPRSGTLDAQVSTARIMGMNDMMLGRGGESKASTGTAADADTLISQDVSTHYTPPKQSAIHESAIILTTPSGNVALANVSSGSIKWVAARKLFAAAVTFAIDAETGASLQVKMVPDAILPDGSADYLKREMERQMQGLIDGTVYAETDGDEQSIVGAMPNGQLYAMSLGGQPHGSGSYHSQAPITAAKRNFNIISGVGSHPNRIQRAPHYSYEHHLPRRKRCRLGGVNFPACVGKSDVSDIYDNADHSFLVDMNGDNGVVDVYRGYVDFPEHYFTLPHYDERRSHERRRYRRMLRLLGSWLPPFIAMIFVVSFELGRRKRQRAAKEMERQGLSVDQATHVGLIKVFDDSILGYGGHGTVVYKGSLEGRLVAVKRMLRAYHASADREISLLIESDGHANVVRYFLKEVRGDFVYLALELCDLSLHDLILVLGAHHINIDKDNIRATPTLESTKFILSQIANGVKHLHSLRIVHRDLKPANILLAAAKGPKSHSGDVLQVFQHHEYVAKISDMGLGKQLMGQSSFGASILVDSIRGQSNGAQSSIGGIGPGSVGWQAPEVMSMRSPSDASARSEESSAMPTDSQTGDSVSPVEAAGCARTSRSVDIFSLGCIFYSTIVPTAHAFGEWWEREANIMYNRPDIAALKGISADAYDLVQSMIQRNPRCRPTATQVCDHPFFWYDERRLSFLCDFSDRIESDAIAVDDRISALTLLVERKASEVVGLSWDTELDAMLVNNVVRFRTYDPSSVRDLLRLVRNKSHHFDELPSELKSTMNNSATGLLKYFELRFPGLLIHCYNVCRSYLPKDDQLCERYTIVPLQAGVLDMRIEKQITTITEQIDKDVHHDEMLSLPEKVPSSSNLKVADELDRTECNTLDPLLMDELAVDDPARLLAPMIQKRSTPTPLPGIQQNDTLPDAGEIIIWEASSAAKNFHCRGWSRSDEEWERRVVDSSIRRRDNKDLIRCSEDPRFRTRLCNHWSVSYGTACPMRIKRKCIFAHGPVELRVKEGKLRRWGKLVDINGDNSNKAHSGGEDTYGIAKSIEAERSSQGKCKAGSNGKATLKKPATPASKKNKAAKVDD